MFKQIMLAIAMVVCFLSACIETDAAEYAGKFVNKESDATEWIEYKIHYSEVDTKPIYDEESEYFGTVFVRGGSFYPCIYVPEYSFTYNVNLVRNLLTEAGLDTDCLMWFYEEPYSFNEADYYFVAAE